MTLFVIVGNAGEADEYREKHKDQKGVYIISRVGALKGKVIREKDKVMFYGTALGRRDIDNIMRELEKCRRN